MGRTLSSGGSYPASWADAVWQMAQSHANMKGVYLDDFHGWNQQGVAELAAVEGNLTAQSARIGRRLESFLTVYTSEMPGGTPACLRPSSPAVPSADAALNCRRRLLQRVHPLSGFHALN